MKPLQSFTRVAGLLALTVLLASCYSIELDTRFARDAAIHSQIIDQSEDRFADIDPLYLSAEIKQLVSRHLQGARGQEERVAKLQELMYSEDYLNLQYTDQQTHTALEAFLAREGNCLSAMNLYVAMARYVGIDAKFQTVEVQPSWDQRGGLLVLSQHINATGKFSVQRRYIVDFTPEIALQQLTSREVSDLYARGLYFNNLGVEEMIDGNMEEALEKAKSL